MSQLQEGALVRVGEMHVEEAPERLTGPPEVCSQLYCETLPCQDPPIRRAL